MKTTAMLLSAIAAVLGATAAQATTVFTASLDGAQAGTGAAGTGSATVTLNDAMTAVDVSVTFAGLTGPAIAAHIHCCAAPGASAPIVVPFPGFPAATSGSFSTTGLAIAPADVTGLFGGLAYVNIHTAMFPLGEIRGQLSEVPEPGTAGLLVAGLTGLAGAGLRQVRSRSGASRGIEASVIS
jgi:hypothetical protein